ncbi:hypothetical protein F946_01079 [Acinetobacter johnsonii ANC 3681]|uniref:Uncharacterized protein n=1 Tax=Acinetobacter johnsonii ANC 3681 TaxID=1217662 RepID=N9BIU3_ACIJO|nr:hypothetical protein [Acinetobacter johnsonii]ENV73567.1 hypothetical protein F946_01079 [Acinetobacter johnsonii ANC 3681]
MTAQTQMSNSNQSVGLLNLEAFELSQRIAKMLSSSTLVPEQYRATIQKKAGKDEYGNQLWREEPNPNGLSNCVIALNMSNRMGADPLMVMQNLYLVNGRPSWSSQFIMAGINSSGRFSALRFELEDLGEKEVECVETVWENRKPKKISKTVKIHDFSCVAWAIERETGERLESSKITIEMAVKEGWYTKEGSKWQTMSEQMLRYRAASFFGRVYAPELLMGLRSAEEEQDRIIDVTPEAESKVINASDFKHIKGLILKAKSLDSLEELESSIYALSDESERNELIKLWKANADKYKVTDVDVPAKKPEPEKEEAPPVDEPAQEKKPRAQTRKAVITEEDEKYQTLLADLIERSKVAKTANEVSALVKYTNAWSAEQRAPLHEAIAKRLAEFKTNEPEPTQSEENLSVSELQRLQKEAEKLVAQKKEAQQAPAVNEIKSDQIIGGLKIQIGNAQNITELEAVAKTIRDNKPNLTPDHMNDVLNVYAARKQFLENQLSMFDTDDTPWVDKAIAEIEAAKNQDEINNIFIDPMYEEQSDPDQQRITNAAQKRESELFGN